MGDERTRLRVGKRDTELLLTIGTVYGLKPSHVARIAIRMLAARLGLIKTDVDDLLKKL